MSHCDICGGNIPGKEDIAVCSNLCHCMQSVDAFLFILYSTYPKLKIASDDFHHARLMPGKACPDCIRMALNQLLQ